MTTAQILLLSGVTREQLGARVREAWVNWALAQPHPKPAWLTPYGDLSPDDQEADNQIGEQLFAEGFLAGHGMHGAMP